MHLTAKVVRSRSHGPLYSVEYLDLSSLGIVTLDGLKQCIRLQTLNLHGNNIEIVQNLEHCRNLWRLNLCNCKVSNLDGLSKFIALGSLNLVSNDLDWSELMKIRHMHILDLSLHGNQKLEKDKYYRIHVIDSLPNVWMLDGRIVTSAERTQIENFFQVSALSKWPVRHKLTREQFVPSSLKKIEVSGIYGDRTTHFMMRFPTKSLLSNIDTDRRRLKYLSYSLQKDLQLEIQHRKCDPRIKLYQTTYMENLINARVNERDRCNVLLLLLVASLEFLLPTRLLQETLNATKLTDVGGVETIELFLIPQEHRYQIASLLLSAVKVERDDKKDGGLYDQLYLSLYHTIAELHQWIHTHGHTSLLTPSKDTKKADSCNEFRSLLAAEVVQVFCIVPIFFDYITKDSGIMRLVSVATADSTIVDKIADLIDRITTEGGDLQRVIEEVAHFLICALNNNTKTVLGRRIPTKSLSSYILSTPRALPRRPQSSPVHISQHLAMGRPSPNPPLTTSRIRPATAQAFRGKAQQNRRPRLGDKMLLAPQNLGFIIALPEYDMALVQMDSIPASNGSVVTSTSDMGRKYCYIHMAQVIWDAKYQYWKPVGTIGDRITIRNVNDVHVPTSPRRDFTPPSSPQEDQQPPLSPKEEVEDLPSTVSALLRERLKMSPQNSLPEADLKPAVTNAKPVEPKEKYGLEDELPTACTNKESPVLYDCLRCAVDTVKSNNAVMISRPEGRSEKLTVEGEEARRPEEMSGCSSKPALVRKTSDSSSSQTIEVDLRPDSEMLSDYQVIRTEEWKKSSSRPQSSKSVAHGSRASTPTQGRYREPCGSPVFIQTANDWLAGGLNVHYIERLVSRMKLHHTPGWLEGISRKRPQSVGPNRTVSNQTNRRRAVKSAGTTRSAHRSTGYTVSLQPPPSPASSTDIKLPVQEPDYLRHARHHNFTTTTNHPIPNQRSVTPPYGGPHRPPSPLGMQIK